MGQPHDSMFPSLRRPWDPAFGTPSASAPSGNGAPEDATSDKHSVLKEPPPSTQQLIEPPRTQQLIEPPSTQQLIEPPSTQQLIERPAGVSKWNFNLGTPDAMLQLPPVPADWSILQSLPTGSSKWNFNLGTPDATLRLPPVPADWAILKSLPRDENRATMPEAMFRGLDRCIKRHRHRHDMVG